MCIKKVSWWILQRRLSDADGDGYFSDEDCDDNSSTIYPGAEELCDGVDNDCDGDIDEGDQYVLLG